MIVFGTRDGHAHVRARFEALIAQRWAVETGAAFGPVETDFRHNRGSLVLVRGERDSPPSAWWVLESHPFMHDGQFAYDLVAYGRRRYGVATEAEIVRGLTPEERVRLGRAERDVLLAHLRGAIVRIARDAVAPGLGREERARRLHHEAAGPKVVANVGLPRVGEPYRAFFDPARQAGVYVVWDGAGSALTDDRADAILAEHRADRFGVGKGRPLALAMSDARRFPSDVDFGAITAEHRAGAEHHLARHALRLAGVPEIGD